MKKYVVKISSTSNGRQCACTWMDRWTRSGDDENDENEYYDFHMVVSIKCACPFAILPYTILCYICTEKNGYNIMQCRWIYIKFTESSINSKWNLWTFWKIQFSVDSPLLYRHYFTWVFLFSVYVCVCWVCMKEWMN